MAGMAEPAESGEKAAMIQGFFVIWPNQKT
jgi:hypothetical protein